MTARHRLRGPFLLTAFVTAGAAVVASACSAPNASARVAPSPALHGADFMPVALMLLQRCGSIDCHGSTYRNMRLYGYGATRLDPTHQPDAPETTPAEAEQDYQAVVGLEPELLRQVVEEKGSAPERLVLVRKGRGVEEHEGGQRLVPGDLADACLLSWLASAVDLKSCKNAVPRLL